MIDHAVRYFPILRVLKQEVPGEHSILEVGSGPYGVGEYHPRRFVGCDIGFSEAPRSPMLPVVASGLQLPFGDSSFDAVIASDTLEHVPPEHRRELVGECVRVGRRIVVLGFPCGPRAYALDQRLWADYRRLGLSVPPWLEEHMLHPFPDETLFDSVDGNWEVRSIANDNLRFHSWVIRRQEIFRWRCAFDLLETFAPRLVEYALRLADFGPCYRRIFALIRRPSSVTNKPS